MADNSSEERMNFLITLDIDWAPDWVVDEVAEKLRAHNVKATWFVTHQSAAISRLISEEKLFELGIHPNCFPGSSHGKTEDEVLKAVCSFVPGAKSMRTHGLYQNTPFLQKAARDFGIKIDVSLFTPGASSATIHTLYFSDSHLIRIPFVWEDDIEMHSRTPIWDPANIQFNSSDYCILNFHPIHLALNTKQFDVYQNIKKENANVQTWSKELMTKHRQDGEGPATMFDKIIKLNSGKGRLISEIISV